MEHIYNNYLKPNVHLYEYQREAVEFLCSVGRVILADDVGLGKSLCVLSAFSHLKSINSKFKLVVICTLKASSLTWSEEISKFLNGIGVSVVLDNKSPNSDADIFITNVFNLDKFSFFFYSIRNNLCVVVDEAHNFGNAKTRYYPIVYKYFNMDQKIPYVWLVTATPITTRLERLYFFVTMIYPGLLKKYRDFFEEYVCYNLKPLGIDGHKKYKAITGYKNVDTLVSIIKPFLLRRVSDSKPQIVEKIIKLDLSKDEDSSYKNAVNGVLSETVRANAIGRIVDCQYIIDIPWKYDIDQASKYNTFLSFVIADISSRKESVIVYVPYRDIGQQLKSKLSEKYETYYIDGSCSLSFVSTVKDKVNRNDGITRILICTDVLSESHNFPLVRNCCFYSLPFDAVTYLQFIGRIWRINSPYDFINVYIVQASNTIDEYKKELLAIRAHHISSIGEYKQFKYIRRDITSDILYRLKRDFLWRRKR